MWTTHHEPTERVPPTLLTDDLPIDNLLTDDLLTDDLLTDDLPSGHLRHGEPACPGGVVPGDEFDFDHDPPTPSGEIADEHPTGDTGRDLPTPVQATPIHRDLAATEPVSASSECRDRSVFDQPGFVPLVVTPGAGVSAIRAAEIASLHAAPDAPPLRVPSGEVRNAWPAYPVERPDMFWLLAVALYVPVGLLSAASTGYGPLADTWAQLFR